LKIALILGTRPEIIKLAPIIKILEKNRSDYFILHTGQHYSNNMDKIFFTDLNLPEPRYNLRIGSGSHAEETGRMLIGIEKILKEESPDVVLLQGDTNTTLAGALAASKLHIRLGHVESGLRSFDRTMPEEINRIVADHLSNYLFAPTEKASKNLIREGIVPTSIFITGNTIVDSIYANMEYIMNRDIDWLTGSKPYLLLTLHREENVDNSERLGNIFKALSLVHSKFGIKIIYPMHPRTQKRVRENKLSIPEGINVTEPLDYFTFLKLESQARLVLTDSGGVQEEACILRVPCVTLRDNTERPETVDVGANVLAGTEPASILEKVKLMLEVKGNWSNPFGDGRASYRIIQILNQLMRN